jgi:transcriptional regulator
MIKARNDIVKGVFKYKNENSIKIPVSFQNLISFIKSIFSIIYLRVKYN